MTGPIQNLEQLEQRRARAKSSDPLNRRAIAVCGGTSCRSAGAVKLRDAFGDALSQAGLDHDVAVVFTGCHGFCEAGPTATVRPAGFFYPRLKPAAAAEIVRQSVIEGAPVVALAFRDANGEPITEESEIPFYKGQHRLISGNNPYIHPTSLDDYLAVGGYVALARALFDMAPAEIIAQIDAAGLRGRGGGGFPTARKWAAVAQSERVPRYLICNADEGDPGAFMDQSILEGNPHAVIEGMLIGARAVGADSGFVYVRHEYPLAVARLTEAVAIAREAGLLGEDILGSGMSFDLTISRGGGAFVCGESTALIASLEGRVGEPRAKYIHTVTHGLFQQPTVLNNVETWANVPLIVRQGSGVFAAVGTAGSRGTKIFSLVGKTAHTGLVEVPMGTTLRRIVFGNGGGVRDHRRFKAIQTGGPSGGCIPESLLDLPVDFDALSQAGSMMGSGGMIVMDDRDCMVDVARYYVSFLHDESCGKCTPCREGLAAARDVLDRIAAGKGQPDDIGFLEEIGDWLKSSSLCGLGQSAANPFLSVLSHFREEVCRHIEDRQCPAGVCTALINYTVVSEKCDGCHACSAVCPSDAIAGTLHAKHQIDTVRCIKCGACIPVCRPGAIERG